MSVSKHFGHTHHLLGSVGPITPGVIEAPVSDITTYNTHSLRSVLTAGVSGVLCGGFATLLAHPLDTLKTRLQNASSKIQKPLRTIIGQYGWKGLYSGIGGPMVISGLATGLTFQVYEGCLYYLERRHLRIDESIYTPKRKREVKDSFIAGLISGSAVAILTTPIHFIKTQLQTHPPGQKPPTTFGFLRQFVSERGMLGAGSELYRGFVLMCLVEGISKAVYFATYEGLKPHDKKSIEESGMGKGGKGLSQQLVFASVASGMACWALVYPFDAVKTRLFAQPLNGPWYSGRQIAAQMWRTQGVRAFYRGCWFTVTRSGPVAAGVLLAFDALQFVFNSQK